jgi:hypothetical protein
MHDNDPEVDIFRSNPSLCTALIRMYAQVLEREKRRNLARHPYQTSSPHVHSPGWNETLATASEANVKVLIRPYLYP